MVLPEKRVLVVDDEQIVRDSCERALTDAGYSVRTVGSGRDALTACRSERFDVMLTDLKMPEMDGLEIARAVRKEFPDVRVVIITGYPSRDSARRAESLGIFDYLEKPLSPERLSEATAEALARPAAPLETVAAEAPGDFGAGAVATGPRAERTAAAAPTAEAEPRELPQPAAAPSPESPGAATSKALAFTVVGAVGFFAGVTVSYAINPTEALSYLAVGAAIVSGVVFGLFPGAIFGRSRPNVPAKAGPRA